MTSSEYNGWTNYETWCVNLWLSNDEGTMAFMLSKARELMADELLPPSTHFDSGNPRPRRSLDAVTSATMNLADQISDWHDDNSQRFTNDVYSDLMKGALGRVDWKEIAEVFIQEVKPICEVCKNDVHLDRDGFMHTTADDKPICDRCIESGRASGI